MFRPQIRRENTYSRNGRESTRATAGVIADCDIIELPSIGIKNWVNETNSRFTNVNALLINQCDKSTDYRRRARRSVIQCISSVLNSENPVSIGGQIGITSRLLGVVVS
jgi:hypothetical protein